MKREKLKGYFIGLGLAMATLAVAGTYTLFQPATGVLVGDASTYVTTAASSVNIRALWSGTCNASSFLRGDGACSVPAGTGLTSVGLTMPTGFSVANSPLTADGTIDVTTTLNGVLHGNGSAFTAGNVSLTAEVSGVLPVANGGTNLNASVDDNTIIGNGTTWQSKAIPNCQDSAGNHLNYNTTTNVLSCGTTSSVTAPVGANPTGTAGLTAVNGAAATFLRSDGAPALSQAITPTWTGSHTFGNTTAQMVFNNSGAGADAKNTIVRTNGTGIYTITSATDAAPTTPVTNAVAAARTGAAWSSVSFGNTTDNPSFSFLGSGAAAFGGAVGTKVLTVTGPSGGTAAVLTDGTVSSSVTFSGPSLQFGTTSNHSMSFFTNNNTRVVLGAAGGLNVSSGNLQQGGVNACLSDGTNCPATASTAGTFTATLAGCSTSPTSTGKWSKVGSTVTINYTALSGTCTSNTTTKTFDATVPAAERPAANVVGGLTMAEDNGTKVTACIRVQTTGVVDFDTGGTTGLGCAGANWTAAGTFGLPSFAITYQVAN